MKVLELARVAVAFLLMQSVESERSVFDRLLCQDGATGRHTHRFANAIDKCDTGGKSYECLNFCIFERVLQNTDYNLQALVELLKSEYREGQKSRAAKTLDKVARCTKHAEELRLPCDEQYKIWMCVQDTLTCP